ncbi:hypothetical protein AAH678_25790 [Sodalis endosymbiont of Spalangia cameroni]|uniref:hypothetical protein n=1 Tax=Sodalis praecaptivus TaxID=1239307 RepID=UPI0031F90E64
MNPSNISSTSSIHPASQSLRSPSEQTGGPSVQTVGIAQVGQSVQEFKSEKEFNKQMQHISLSDISEIKIGGVTYKKTEKFNAIAFRADTDSKKDQSGSRIDGVTNKLNDILNKQIVLKSNVEMLSKRLMLAARKVNSPMSLFSQGGVKKRCESAIGNMGHQKLVSSELTDKDVAMIVEMAIAKLTPVEPENFARIEAQPQKALSELINESKKLTADDKMQLREYIDALSYCHTQEVKKKGAGNVKEMGECYLIASTLFKRNALEDKSTGKKDLPGLLRTLLSAWREAKADSTTDVTGKRAVGPEGQSESIEGKKIDHLCEMVKRIAEDPNKNDGLFREVKSYKELGILEKLSKQYPISSL